MQTTGKIMKVRGNIEPDHYPSDVRFLAGERLNNLEMIGESRKLRDALKQSEVVSATDCPVLILGETGTGKELVATLIHNCSPRQHNAFVKVNCAAIPLGLL